MCRRFVVHQFVLDCVERALLKGHERPTLLFVTIEAVGLCYVRHKNDPFLQYMKSDR